MFAPPEQRHRYIPMPVPRRGRSRRGRSARNDDALFELGGLFGGNLVMMPFGAGAGPMPLPAGMLFGMGPPQPDVDNMSYDELLALGERLGEVKQKGAAP
jgi:hypothetical protein